LPSWQKNYNGEKTEMTDSKFSNKIAAPKYGSLEATRRQSKKAYDLVNCVSIKFGSSINWNNETRFNSINRPGKPTLFFKFHSNKFAPIVEFLGEDVELLKKIKESFPDDFVSDVLVKEELL
jgi:hypothetical protein